ncbi:MAG: hypothetical protein IT444_05280 [Phycisphaeraceae bacterium]|nr:hypothetical protein [Phycisphaeraceae bacterium]
MTSPSSSSEPAPLHPERLTWAALLGRWVDFARSSLALPEDESGERLRRSVPDIIMLQAVWFALANLQELDASERALGLDRAAVLIEKHTKTLEAVWRGSELPEALRDVMREAREELSKATG